MKNYSLFPFLVFFFLLGSTAIVLWYLNQEWILYEQVFYVIAFIFLLLFICACRLSRQKYFSWGKLKKARKEGVKDNTHQSRITEGNSIYAMTHNLYEFYCDIVLQQEANSMVVNKTVYSLVSSRPLHLKGMSRHQLTKRYLGIPGKGDYILIKSTIKMPGIEALIGNGERIDNSYARKFRKLYNIVLNTIRLNKKNLLGSSYMPFLCFDRGVVSIAMRIPNIRYDKYYINGEIPENIDHLICQFDQTKTEIEKTYKEYVKLEKEEIERLKKMWKNIKSVGKATGRFALRSLLGIWFLDSFFDFGESTPELEDTGISSDDSATDDEDTNTPKENDENNGTFGILIPDDSPSPEDDFNHSGDSNTEANNSMRNSLGGEYIQCPLCNGSGLCWHCGGSTVNIYDVGFSDEKPFKCEECHGMGRCSYCGGRKKLYRPYFSSI